MQNKIKLIEESLKLLTPRLKACDICPRNCKVNRIAGKRGYCKAGVVPVVYTAFLHRGEEPALSAAGGSGTIFFSGCNLGCIYCQNYKFSHFLEGSLKSPEHLADMMLKLQNEKAHNINLVTPTHFLPQILESLHIAISRGLKIPIVYNTSGYEKKEIIAKLSGIVDIYLPDMKYIGEGLACECSSAADYSIYNKEAILEMYKQKNKASFNGDVLMSGLVIRHLVIPGHVTETAAILSWIKENVPDCLTSIMFQYQPYYKAKLISQINRTINLDEYNRVVKLVEELGLCGWVQDFTQKEDMAGVYFNPNNSL
ncbi:MAG: radical SAM protein [Candidatus Omnitrophica bacterium]|jgi:putative pyruvate formate lyase activating enzyme|nr:radical SAM protein [Candidatus Omnitrophota bacterium]